MLSMSAAARIYLCREPVDFRKAHDGLCAIVRDAFRDDPFNGDSFTFFNRAKDRIKILIWDRNGFWLLYKRLERGTFPFDVRGEGDRIEISRAQLMMILEGIDSRSVRTSSNYTSSFAIKRRGNGDGSHTRPSV